MDGPDIVWVSDQDSLLTALLISIAGMILIGVVFIPLSYSFTFAPIFASYLFVLFIGGLAFKYRVTPKKKLQFRKGMHVFEFLAEGKKSLSPARFDQIDEFLVVPRDNFMGSLNAENFTMDDYWKTKLILKMHEGTDSNGNPIGANASLSFNGTDYNYESFISTLLSWGILKSGSGDSLLVFA